jgi:hypothetical protein
MTTKSANPDHAARPGTYRWAFLLLALPLLAALPAPANGLGPTGCESLLTNGSFETTPQPIDDGDFDSFAAIPGWNLESGNAIEVQRNLNGAAADGDHWVELAASSPTTISQSVTVTPGALYELRFAYSARPFFGDDNASRVSWAGAERTLQSPAVGAITWQYASLTAAAPTSGSGKVTFEDLSGGNGAAGMFIDDVTLCRVEVCSEELVVPSFLVQQDDPNGTTTLFAVRNLTGAEVTADVEYVTTNGASQRRDTITLGAFETVPVNLRDVAGLGSDPDGFSRGFVRIVAAGGPDGVPVLAGDFFQVDVGNDFATGEELLRRSQVCKHASIRSLDFGSGTRLAVYLSHPRGADEDVDPPSFTVQVFDEAGTVEGAPQPVWTGEHALELAASDFTANPFGTLVFDFTNSAGGAAYAEYSAQGRFSVGVASQCEEAPTCDDCCAPGTPKATTPPLHYVDPELFPSCEVAISDALRSLDSFHYRTACQQAHGGSLPDRVLGARMVSCEVDPPGFGEGVVVVVEACCPPPDED